MNEHKHKPSRNVNANIVSHTVTRQAHRKRAESLKGTRQKRRGEIEGEKEEKSCRPTGDTRE